MSFLIKCLFEEREKRQQQSKNELITNVAHDLRSPLTSIIGYVELLKETGPEDRQRFDEYIETNPFSHVELCLRPP